MLSKKTIEQKIFEKKNSIEILFQIYLIVSKIKLRRFTLLCTIAENA